jgi:hypothetical protein
VLNSAALLVTVGPVEKHTPPGLKATRLATAPMIRLRMIRLATVPMILATMMAVVIASPVTVVLFVAREIRDNQFTIKTDQPRVKVSWQVTGIRRDAWAVANRVAVEEAKPAEERGRHLHPEISGGPEAARTQRENELRWIRRISQLVPEQLRQRVERHLQALLRGEPVDREELQRLTTEARHPLEERSRRDRARLEEEWRKVEQFVQRRRR